MRQWRWAIIVIGVSVWVACTGNRGVQYSTPTLAPLAESAPGVFPHSGDWSTPERHGKFSRKYGTTVCGASCHGADLEGAAGPACAQCHADYPHPVYWSWPSLHGATVRTQGMEACAGCHGSEGLGGSSGVACTTCHSQYPHPDGWASREQHAAVVRDQGATSCATQCHGTDFQGGLSGVSCRSCHALYPHPSNWNEADQHGAQAQGDAKSACTACHGTDFSGGTSQVACATCHADYPHVADWRTPEQHGAQVVAQGTASCATQCHGADLQGGLSGIRCQSCHALYPHAAGWKDVAQHGAVVRSAGTEGCTSCHGVDLLGGTSQVSCHSCHASYPHPEGWAAATAHGASVVATGTASCATQCHGTDLQGGESGIGCQSCHALYPHAAGWTVPTAHGTAARGVNRPLCAACHGNDWTGGTVGIGCFQSGCHMNTGVFPHIVGWSQPVQHGTVAKAGDLTSCAACHGSDWQGGKSQVSCFAAGCHAVETHFPHPPDWAESSAHGVIARDATERIGCRQCHGATWEESGSSGVSCGSCHAYYPHGEGWREETGHGWTRYELGDDFPATCLDTCHGTDGSLGGAGQACTGCHSEYPHTADWSERHGARVLTATETVDPNDDTFDEAAFNQRCVACHGGLTTFTLQTFDLQPADQQVMMNGEVVNQRCHACHRYPHRTVWYDVFPYNTIPAPSGKPWYEGNWYNAWPMDYAHAYAITAWAAAVGLVDQWSQLPNGMKQADFVRATCGYSADGNTGCHTDGPEYLQKHNSSPLCSTMCHAK